MNCVENCDEMSLQLDASYQLRRKSGNKAARRIGGKPVQSVSDSRIVGRMELTTAHFECHGGKLSSDGCYKVRQDEVYQR